VLPCDLQLLTGGGGSGKRSLIEHPVLYAQRLADTAAQHHQRMVEAALFHHRR
jgi:hypothetical protein